MINLIYIIKTVLISGLLLGYYGLFLRNRFFHGFNRYFLLTLPFLSLLLPALHFKMNSFWNASNSASPIRLLGVGQGKLEEAFTITASSNHSSALSMEFIITAISLLISGVLLIRFFKSVLLLNRMRKNKPFLQIEEATVYFVSEKGTPFSYFNTIFWGKEMDMNNPAGQQILRHELFHVRQRHSLDIMIMEIFSIFFWFNPFTYLIRRELKAIHEYSADAYAAAETDHFAYARLLLQNMTGSPLPLANPFFKNQIKKRIAMITKTQKSKSTLLGRFMILPLIAVLTILFSFKIQNHFHLTKSNSIRVVIDAGHSATFLGAEANGVQEKDLNLSIAKKIQALSKDYNVEVIMTRETDQDAATDNLISSLRYRSTLAEKTKAELFISIHANLNQSTQKDGSGFFIYVPKSDNKFYESSVKLGSIITNYIKSDYTISPELQQADGHVQVIDRNTVPSILIECGFLDNKADMAYMLNEKNQEKIARDILEGIRKYSTQTTTFSNGTPELTDTISYEAMKKLDVNSIESMTVDKQNHTIILTLRDSKKSIVFVTAEVKNNLDSKGELQMDNSELNDALDSNIPYKKVEIEAEFPGGQQGWYQYLAKNLVYPDSAVAKEIQGTVIVEFIVKKDGSVTDIKAISGPQALKNASILAIRESGKWLPAKQNGYLVDSYRKQPFVFKLEKKS